MTPKWAWCGSSTPADGRHDGPCHRRARQRVATFRAASADSLNQCDVAIVQHEYGLYGGTDGDEVLEILGALHVPSIVIAHTILTHPTPHQRSVLNEVAALADRVVVMTEAARKRLCEGSTWTPPRSTPSPTAQPSPLRRVVPDPRQRPVMLTWGLIGPGKGIERVIEAMPTLHDLPVRPRYLVAGQTHPKVLAAQGESYRRGPDGAGERLGSSSSVVFDADYRDVASLTALIQSSTVVVLPYDSKDQVTSGVLVDAIAAGRPVVATAFPHAVELLSTGAGIVVDHDDPDALAHALRRVLTRPELAAAMAAEASRIAPSLGWPVVAGEYLRLADRLLARTARAGMSRARDSRARLRPPRPHDRRARHLRARPLPRAQAGARLLHRRHGPRPGRDAREPDATSAVHDLALAQPEISPGRVGSQGKCRNRMNRRGTWEDSPGAR